MIIAAALFGIASRRGLCSKLSPTQTDSNTLVFFGEDGGFNQLVIQSAHRWSKGQTAHPDWAD
jgi:hypothetical protein